MKTTLVIAVLACCLAACSSRGEPLLDQVERMVGKTTQEQFLRRWGSPLSITASDQGEIWLYRHMALHFDPEGVLRGYYAHTH
jgi:hypothetical protein